MGVLYSAMEMCVKDTHLQLTHSQDEGLQGRFVFDKSSWV